MLLVMQDGLGLRLDAVELVLLVDGVDCEPGGDGSRVDVDVVEQQGTAHGQHLND